MNKYNPHNPHVSPTEIKRSLSKHKTEEHIDYKSFYNEINYISPGIHMRSYYDVCVGKLNEGEKWLDVGCGCANFLKQAISDKNIKLYGMDVVDESVTRAIKNGVNCIKNSASDPYPYENESFDMVTSTDVLEHLHPNDVDKALKEIFRVVKNNRHALLAPATTPDLTGLLHLTVQSRDWWVKKLQETGFQLVSYVAYKGILLRK
jgi:ubiquinone/menaquinone biosynthesis C-methylase UbiE